MGLLREAYRNVHNGGLSVLLEALTRGYLTIKPAEGDHVYEEEWDLLVVLDACRADLWAEVAPQYDRFGAGECRTSVGGTSSEWLTKTIDGADPTALEETAYVTGNPYSADYVDADAFALVDEVWRYEWDESRGTIPARPITDRAIQLARGNERFDRLIVHYMQPHFPCVPDTVPTSEVKDGIALDRFGEEPLSVWEALRFDQCDRDEVWQAYRKNLQYVLDELELLLENVDADRAVVTSDHGNAIGEYWLYGHVGRVAHPAIRHVPWYETSANDERTHKPATGSSSDRNREELDATPSERLRTLGYTEQ